MIYENLTLESLLTIVNLSREEWDALKIDWEPLKDIAIDHEENHKILQDNAEFFARVLQKCLHVHSVRWRVKSTSHLLKKIVRKVKEGSEKYTALNKDNYYQVITDLVGVRVLHLFKDEWKPIHEYIVGLWELKEDTIIYIRKGDVPDTILPENCQVKEHASNYRSVHYIPKTSPLKRELFSEIQVRTIFEEGWSEIDHKIRYPDFSDNDTIVTFLNVFNRLAGSADEMGTFVNNLSKVIEHYEDQVESRNRSIEEHMTRIEQLGHDLQQAKHESESRESKINELNTEIKSLKSYTDKAVSKSGNSLDIQKLMLSSKIPNDVFRFPKL